MTTHSHNTDTRIPEYIHAIERIRDGHYQVEIPTAQPDDIGQLGTALHKLAQTIEYHYYQTEKLNRITSHINAGLLLDEILDHVYEEFRSLIPYDRIGFSLIEPGPDGLMVRARWTRSDLPHVALGSGYAAPLAGSSLETIISTGQPRIIEDLSEYTLQKPESQSTKLILQEGIRSSLTCPLIINGSPVGFMFFSSTLPQAYQDVHVELFQRIAAQLSTILQKGRLVSEIVEQRQEIDRQNQELRLLNDLKNTFLGIAAHDLRSPTGNIQMAMDLLMTDEGDIDAKIKQQILAETHGQTQYMINLLDDLLDVAQIESGKLVLNPVLVDLHSFLEDTVKRHSKLAAHKGTTVKLALAATGMGEVDPTRMRQIMDNLVSNATKYSPPGSVVMISGSQDEQGWWYIGIQDQGPGISAEDRQHLFQDFARLSAHPTGGEKSTGLGLSIAKRIIEAHGGEIGVDSSPGQGATFWLRIPTSQNKTPR